MSANELAFKTSLDGDGVKQGCKNIKAEMDGLKTASTGVKGSFDAVLSSGGNLAAVGGFAGIAVAGVATLAAGVAFATQQFNSALMSAAKYGDELDNLAKKAGVSTDAAQRLNLAAKIADVEFNDITKSVKNIAVDLTKMAAGNEDVINKYKQLGITFDDLKAKSPDQQFELVIKKLANVKDITSQTAIATDILGKSGMNLATMYRGGVDSLNELFNATDKVIKVSEYSIESLGGLADKYDMLEVAGKNAFAELMAPSADVIAPVIDNIMALIKELGDNGSLKRWGEGLAEIVATLVTGVMHLLELMREINKVTKYLPANFIVNKTLKGTLGFDQTDFLDKAKQVSDKLEIQTYIDNRKDAAHKKDKANNKETATDIADITAKIQAQAKAYDKMVQYREIQAKAFDRANPLMSNELFGIDVDKMEDALDSSKRGQNAYDRIIGAKLKAEQEGKYVKWYDGEKDYAKGILAGDRERMLKSAEMSGITRLDLGNIDKLNTKELAARIQEARDLQKIALHNRTNELLESVVNKLPDKR